MGGISGISSLTIDPTNSSTLFAATSRGLFRSTDAGQTWKNVGQSMAGFGLMVAIDPVTPATVYALTVGHIYKSLDGGDHWDGIYNFTSPQTGGTIAIDPRTPSTLYVSVTNADILKSTNGGATWAAIRTGLPDSIFATGALSLVIDPKTPSTLYAGSFAGSYVSDTPPIYNPGTGSIAKSTDGGATWQVIRAGIPQNAFMRSLAIKPNDPSTVYAAYAADSTSGVMESSDGGENWSVIDTQSANVSQIAIDPSSGALLAAYTSDSGYGGIFKSQDAGGTWNAASAGLTFIDLRVLVPDPSSPSSLYTGGAGGVFKSVDLGTTWTALGTVQIAGQFPTPVPFAAGAPLVRSMVVSPADSSQLYLQVTRLGGGCNFTDKLVFKSTDGGADWSDSISPPQTGCDLGSYIAYATLMAIDPKDANTVYLGETEDEDGIYALLKSIDGGANWTSVWDYHNGLGSGLNALAIDPKDSSKLYAGIGDGGAPFGNTAVGVFKSTDGGNTWNATVLNASAVTVLAIDPANTDVIYAATQGIYLAPLGFRGLYKSTDAGASWTAINNGLDTLIASGVAVSALAVDPGNSSIVYAGTQGDGIYRSVDGGAHWSRLSDGLTDPNLRSLGFSMGTPRILFAATSGGVFQLVDSLKTGDGRGLTLE